MKIKHGYYVIKIIIVFCLLLNIIFYVYNKMIQNKEINLMKQATSNFSQNIKVGDYQYSKDIDALLLDNGKNFEDVFAKNSTYMNLTKSITVTYNEYIITKNDIYIIAKINDELVMLKYPYLIPTENLLNLRKKIVNNEVLRVFPFNDAVYCLIQDGTDSYIMNIETAKETWHAGNYYESPSINYINDTLECGGDLSSNHYVFDKYGTLQQTKTPSFPLISVVNTSSILSILLVFLIIINCNIKNIPEKILYNILIILLIIFFIAMLLLTFLLY